jgi:hypothetical protein
VVVGFGSASTGFQSMSWCHERRDTAGTVKPRLGEVQAACTVFGGNAIQKVHRCRTAMNSPPEVSYPWTMRVVKIFGFLSCSRPSASRTRAVRCAPRMAWQHNAHSKLSTRLEHDIPWLRQIDELASVMVENQVIHPPDTGPARVVLETCF